MKEHITPENGNRHEKDEQKLDGPRKEGPGQNLILLTSIIMWPAGWDSVTIREVCGGSVGPYSKGNCSIGWAPLASICGIILLLISAILSIAVDKSITTQTATRQILMNEKSCVFLR
ncbi:unnamed protein product [Schistosoma margrebowiei]|uniref:Uncharacterized protein n=1 Tax=Schistosoma margrebowiei TaxID=48269 RepID=A0A183MJ91_9TREM|nr:unnamed protein product [Schistosoma margrebowiei]